MRNPIVPLIVLLILVIGVGGCSDSSQIVYLKPGKWIFKLNLDNDKSVILPVTAQFTEEGELFFFNADETISVDEIEFWEDSVRIVMPVFGSVFLGKHNGTAIAGSWIKYNAGPDYKIPFSASLSDGKRFESSGEDAIDFSGRWESYFINNNSDTSRAIALFKQDDNLVTGTFLTEVGDYRYLEGIVNGNSLKLSTFDGAHAFLFEGELNTSKTLVGSFRSGHRYQADWIAIRSDSAQLGDMKQLTYLKPGYDNISFSFPDENGNILKFPDKDFENKVVILQILGTWCPNCMDETRYLTELYKRYNKEGLEVIGLDFEPRPTLSYFRERVSRFRKDLDVPYPIVLAGHSDKNKAAAALPMLNHVLSYPTAIFIDRKGQIREIHTGFTGPGTGKLYENYKVETDNVIKLLLNE